MHLITSIRRSGRFTKLATCFAASLLSTAAVSSATTISVSNDVLRGGLATPGTLADGFSSTGDVNLVKFIPLNGTSAASYTTTYTNVTNGNGGTIDFSPYIPVTGCCERGAVQNIQINGYSTGNTPSGNLYLRTDTAAQNFPGFGAHANWLVTIDLNAVRATNLGGSSSPLELAGQFGTWGGIGDGTAPAGVIQGAIFLDGTRIDSMAKSVANPNPSSPTFDLTINSGRFLTFAILNGSAGDTSATLWDDGLFKNVTLSTVPEPASLTLLTLGSLGALARRRRA